MVMEERIENGEMLLSIFKKEKYKKAAIFVLDFIVLLSVIALMGQAFFLLFSHESIENVDNMNKFFYRLDQSLLYIKVLSIIGIVAWVLSTILKGVKLQGSFKDICLKVIKEYPELICLAGAFIWTFFSTMHAYYSQMAWNGNEYNNEGFLTVILYVFIFILAYSVKRQKSKEAAMLVFLASAALISFIGSIEVIFNKDLGFDQTRMVFNNSNHLGYFYAISTVMAMGCFLYAKNLKWSIIYGILYTMSLFGAFQSLSEGSMLAIIFGIIFTIITYSASCRKMKDATNLYFGKIVIILIIFATMLFICEVSGLSTFLRQMKSWIGSIIAFLSGEENNSVEDGSLGSGRLVLWITACKIIGKSPLWGRGLDCYNDYGNSVFVLNIKPEWCDMPHNEYLQIGANVGIIPLLLYLAAILIIYIRALRCRKTLTGLQLVLLNSAFAYCVSAFFGNTFTYTYPFFIMILAMAAPKYSQRANMQCYAGEYLTLQSYQEGSEAYKAVLTAREKGTIINEWTLDLSFDKEIVDSKTINQEELKNKALEEMIKNLGITKEEIEKAQQEKDSIKDEIKKESRPEEIAGDVNKAGDK